MILEGTGKGLLDSLIAEGGVKSRDLSRVIYMGVVIEIRRARSDRNTAKFYGYPYFTFYLEEIFCAHNTSYNLLKMNNPQRTLRVLSSNVLNFSGDEELDPPASYTNGLQMLSRSLMSRRYLFDKYLTFNHL